MRRACRALRATPATPCMAGVRNHRIPVRGSEPPLVASTDAIREAILSDVVAEVGVHAGRQEFVATHRGLLREQLVVHKVEEIFARKPLEQPF